MRVNDGRYKSPCTIIRAHADELQDDPDRLSSDFMARIVLGDDYKERSTGTCKRCGTEISWKRRGGPRQYCDECAVIVRNERAAKFQVDHRDERNEYMRARRRSDRQRRTCQVCGVALVKEYKYCPACQIERRRAQQRVRSMMQRQPRYCTICGDRIEGRIIKYCRKCRPY